MGDLVMMTVAELIALLQTMPQDVPVTGFNGQENTDFVTKDGVNLEHTESYTVLWKPDGTRYKGPYVDIMGF